MFDDGSEAYREWVLPRMIERGILPEGTELTPINPMADGTSSPADAVRPRGHPVGRIVDHLEESGQLENTIIFYCADNGASG